MTKLGELPKFPISLDSFTTLSNYRQEYANFESLSDGAIIEFHVPTKLQAYIYQTVTTNGLAVFINFLNLSDLVELLDTGVQLSKL